MLLMLMLLRMQVLLHAADISNQARPFSVSAAMSERVQQEFTNQVHKERAAGRKAAAPGAPQHAAQLPAHCPEAPVLCIPVQQPSPHCHRYYRRQSGLPSLHLGMNL
jgi:hypothetical protein